MYYRFENLEIWKLGKDFVKEIYQITRKFPKDELFGLSSQLRRAAISVVLNIAEGSERKSDIEFRRFLRISIASMTEVIAGLYLALDLEFIKKPEFERLYNLSGAVIARIKKLTNKLNV